MGRAIWATVKFVLGVATGAVIGAAVTAYAAGAGDAAPKTQARQSFVVGIKESGVGFVSDLRARLTAVQAAGDVAAAEVEAAMTQQFRTQVQDTDALNPPNALHP